MQYYIIRDTNLLGITLSSSRTTANVIEKAVIKFNMKSNEIITDFKLLPCYIKSKLFTTFCTDAYGCQLWNFESREVHNFLCRLEKSSAQIMAFAIYYSLQSAAHN